MAKLRVFNIFNIFVEYIDKLSIIYRLSIMLLVFGPFKWHEILSHGLIAPIFSICMKGEANVGRRRHLNTFVIYC